MNRWLTGTEEGMPVDQEGTLTGVEDLLAGADGTPTGGEELLEGTLFRTEDTLAGLVLGAETGTE